MSKPTTVINVRGTRPWDYVHNDQFVYVGRDVPRRDWKASKWANPFKAGQDPFEAMRILAKIPEGSGRIEFCGPLTPSKAVECYVFHLESLKAHYGPSWHKQISELRGKTLGCWCGSWEPGQPEIACHAVVMAKLANEIVER